MLKVLRQLLDEHDLQWQRDKPELHETCGFSFENKSHTFIRAFESLPVHCLKLRPVLKRRNPGYGGHNAILIISVLEQIMPK